MIGIVWTLVSSKVIAAFKWTTQSAAHILIVALVASLAWGWLGHHNAAKWKRVLASTEQAYRNAQADATKAQIAANLAQQAQWKAKAETTDEKYQKSHTASSVVSERFISRGGHDVSRLRTNCPSGPGGSDTMQNSSHSESDNGAGSAPVMVSVMADDVRVCTENTDRLEAGREWSLTLGD